MHRMTIDNQKHLPRVLLDQPTEKTDHHRSSESFCEYHKRQSTPIRNGRDHVAAKTLACARNHRRLPSETITASGLVIRSHSHFVAPVYLGTFLSSLASDGRVIFFQPESHLFWVLFVGTTKRLLGREAPSFQIASDSPDRHRDTKTLLDQLSHRISGPESEWQPQLVGATLADQTHKGRRLMTGQARLALGATLVSFECRIPSFSMRLEPIVNRSPSNTKEAAGLGLSHSLFENRVNHPLAQFLLGLWSKLSAIVYRHDSSYDDIDRKFNKLCSN
jgi:hypothetical protein